MLHELAKVRPLFFAKVFFFNATRSSFTSFKARKMASKNGLKKLSVTEKINSKK